ncbi:hypothetical protein [Vibrio hangzhouensis]|uniref:hypothetical protein n=1 Tax=Vibrio hangzhouensis TaxID=462991 RepID=UPI001C9869D0|nr:hypothetical protein [Vibrio hangzhouensis]MBY6198290.1 hypothetical protein [Vibrio hangzhouensis]
MSASKLSFGKWLLALLLSLFLSASIAYQHISGEIQHSASGSILKIDKRIDEIVTAIRQFPHDASCPESLMDEYANLAYENERIRAVGFISPNAEISEVCSMFGITQLSEPYWEGNSRSNIFIGWSLLTNYFPETSLVVAIDDKEKRLFAYVNPRRLVGYWLEPALDYANYAFFLPGKESPVYRRADPVGSEYTFAAEQHSVSYPYSISVTADTMTLLARTLVYWLRTLVAMSILGSSVWLLNQSFRDNRLKSTHGDVN